MSMDAPKNRLNVTEALKELAQDVPKIKLDRTPTAIASEPGYIERFPQMRELYKEAELWHGTGRYKYSQSGEVVDILAGMIRDKGIIPHEDPWDGKSGTVDIISTAHSRMYARLYAGMYMPHGRLIQNELGSRELWGYYFLGTFGISAVREYGVSLAQLRHGSAGTMIADLEKAKKWTKKIRPEKISIKDIFIKGTDIDANYPILLGIKKDMVEPAPASHAINMHERRSASPIALTDLTHIEVPKERVEETASMLAHAGHGNIPVIPIEYGEEYCRNFSFHTLRRPGPLDEAKEQLVVGSADRYEDHTFPENPDDMRLADGRPLWYVFLDDPDTIFLKAVDSDAAREELRALFTARPDAVRECIGKPIAIAREKLRSTG